VGGNGSAQQPEPWQKDIYTATLKAAIQVFMKPVPARLSGKEVDAQIRGQVKAAGYDYMHGTGHGVGIHVHEEGIRLSSLSSYPQSANACVSVEPGIYLEGKGGVRVENIALLHLTQDSGVPAYEYENVVFVGYDWDLIRTEQLSPEEKRYLKQYEAKCAELGTTLTACPL
jgi:Xaa-Pro aminopeptidase